MKKCCTCKTFKELLCFHKDKQKIDSLSSVCKECKRQARIRDIDKIKAKSAIYYLKNKTIIKQKTRKYFNEKRGIALNEKTCERHSGIPSLWKGLCLNCVLRAMLRNAYKKALKYLNLKKEASCLVVLGCSIEEYKKHIERQFLDGMNWQNYGKKSGEIYWEIDHLIPLVAIQSQDDINKVCHYTNLQPLWAKDNAKKNCWHNGINIRRNKLKEAA